MSNNIIKYPKLYSRGVKKEIRCWEIEQRAGAFRIISGILNGKSVVSDWTFVTPKNEGKSNATTVETQTEREVTARYKKQLKTGYFYNIEDIDKIKFIEPMLAKNYEDYKDKIDFNKENWVIQAKFNGNRCIATASGLHTRKGERYLAIPHIEESLKPFFDKYPDAVLDGEIMCPAYKEKLNETAKLVRKTVHITEEDLVESKKLIHYFIYDGYNFDGLDKNSPYFKRKEWIDDNIVKKFNHTQFVLTIPIKSKEDLDKNYKMFLSNKEEGAILRNVDKGYENKRSKFLLKVKPDLDSEAVIIDIIEGNGNWSNTAKTATLRWEGKEFDATFVGSQEELKEVLKNKKSWIGKEVTFFFMGLTGLKIPNFARIDVNNCFKTDK